MRRKIHRPKKPKAEKNKRRNPGPEFFWKVGGKKRKIRAFRWL